MEESKMTKNPKINLLLMILLLFSIACIVIYIMSANGSMDSIDPQQATIYFIIGIAYIVFFLGVIFVPKIIKAIKKSKK